jgi:hypothetical protein
MGIGRIEQKVREGAALTVMERGIAFNHGLIPGWCSSCGKRIEPGKRRHFKARAQTKQECRAPLQFTPPSLSESLKYR